MPEKPDKKDQKVPLKVDKQTKAPVMKPSDAKQLPQAPVPHATHITISKNLLIILAILIIVVIIAGIAVVFLGVQPASSGDRVAVGDAVSVRYIGRFENGTVFDTNREDIATQAGLSRTTFEPLEFVVGEGQVIPGFESALVGMRVSERKTVTLEPVQAYGEYNSQLLQMVPRSQEVNRTITLNRTFTVSRQTYTLVFNKEPVLNDIVTEQQENLQYKVTNLTNATVTVVSQLTLDQNMTLFGTEWSSVVIALTPTNATLRQNPQDGQVIETAFGQSTVSVTNTTILITANPVLGATISTPYGSAVVKDLNATTIVLDNNHPFAGKKLVFDIELLNRTAAQNGTTA